MGKIKQVVGDIRKHLNSLKFKLIFWFLFISIIPIFIVQIISYTTTAKKLEENINQLVDVNLIQTQKSINLVLEFYEDFLYQIYTNEEIIEYVEKIDANEDVEININKLRREITKLCNGKESVQAITIKTNGGEEIFYDKLSASSIKSCWINTSQFPYEYISNSNETVLLPSKYATRIGTTSYYVFNMGHRFINYTDVYKKIGNVVISIDEKVLNEVCAGEQNNDEYVNLYGSTFIYDNHQNIISFPDRKKVGRNLMYYHLVSMDKDGERALELKENELYLSDKLVVDESSYIGLAELKDKKTNWTIAYLYDESTLYEAIDTQRATVILISIITIIIVIIAIISISNRLVKSITKVVWAMGRAGTGELSIQVNVTKEMPQEIKRIAYRFNEMVLEINQLISKVKIATTKQKDAEIKALEAQINPHFLYNTLDTINWKAIEKEEYEISNMINSLAKILRYAVKNSNSVVTVQEEIEWIRQYVYLQQSRLNIPFEFILNVDENVLQYGIHKLIFQPIIENSIVHGLNNMKSVGVLEVSIKEVGELLEISVKDNGKGMDALLVEKINSGNENVETKTNSIGVNNVIERLSLYYGEKGTMKVESNIGEGVKVIILIPKLKKQIEVYGE